MKTPLNYTGNKSRLVKQFSDHLPQEVEVFVDLFCGGASVGLSVYAEKVIFIDNDKNVIALLKHLSKYGYDTILKRLEALIHYYGLSYSKSYGYQLYREGVDKCDNNGLKEYNKEGFYRLRADYNLQKDKMSKESLDMLYLLVVYGFNNDLRFNRNGHYNLPIGKTDLNNNNLKKLREYITRVNEMSCEFICGDFRDEGIRKILLSADCVYADPPYLLSDAVYNEGGNWTEVEEKGLLDLLTELDTNQIDFALSNVLRKQNPKIENKLLNDFLLRESNKSLNIITIDYHYRSSSYNKINRNAQEEEILVVNF